MCSPPLSLTVKNRWTHNEMFELYNFIQVNHDYYFSKKVLIIFGDILSDSRLKNCARCKSG